MFFCDSYFRTWIIAITLIDQNKSRIFTVQSSHMIIYLKVHDRCFSRMHDVKQSLTITLQYCLTVDLFILLVSQSATNDGSFEGHGFANDQRKDFIQRRHQHHICSHVETQDGLGKRHVETHISRR